MVRSGSEMALGAGWSSPVKAVPAVPERVVDGAKLANLDWYLLDLVASELGLPSRGHLGGEHGVEWSPVDAVEVTDVAVLAGLLGRLSGPVLADVPSLLDGFVAAAVGRVPEDGRFEMASRIASALRHPACPKNSVLFDLAGLLPRLHV